MTQMDFVKTVYKEAKIKTLVESDCNELEEMLPSIALQAPDPVPRG